MRAPITVTALSIAHVKGTRLRSVDELFVERCGARGDRRFCVIGKDGRMLNAKRLGELQSVVADCDAKAETLALCFADGSEVWAPIRYSGTVAMRFYSEPREARLLEGPWNEALSERLDRPVRIVEPGNGIDRGEEGAVSVISAASLRRLAEQAGVDALDARRFRMTVEVEGVRAHAEDGWLGHRVRIGEALVRFRGHVGRCVITSRDPDTGAVTLPTLKLIAAYRRELESTEPLPFGVHGEVLEPGAVRLGDAVELEDG